MTQDIESKLAIAIGYHQQNELAKAEAAYMDVLRMDNSNYQALFLLGLLYDSSGHMERAAELFEEAVFVQPQAIEANYNLGLALYKLKRHEEAVLVLDRLFTLDPNNCEALNIRALIAYEKKQYVESLKYLNTVLELKPNNVDAINSIGLNLRQLNRIQEALAVFEQGLAIDPSSTEIMYNKALALLSLNRYEDGLYTISNILAKVEPMYITTLYTKGNALLRIKRLKEVTECFKKVVTLDEKYNAARSDLLYSLLCICEWRELEEHTQAFINSIPHVTFEEKDIMVPLTGHLLPGLNLQQQYDLSHRYALQLSEQMQILKQKISFSFLKKRKEKLKIAYISTDFRVHPLSQLIPELLELHDKKHFTVYAYSKGINDNSDVRRRIEKAVDHFVDMESLDDYTVAHTIYNDNIDILIDLTGFSWISPTHLLTLRVAPVQVSYLGYLGTMAADFVDAIIADEFVIPPQSQRYYSEKIYYLPCYQANDRQCPIAPKPSREKCGLPEAALVFCCFNSTYKITPVIFSVWCKLLQQVPNSVLWLLASNVWAVENLQQEAQQHGVDPSRLIFAEPIPLDEHLARLQCADLFLDTSPYNAGTTASNALWAGLPLITYSGESFPSRMAGSLLNALQVPELITYNVDDYYQLALTLATDHKKRHDIAEKIKANRDTAILFDTPFLTRHLEDLYRQMWDDYITS